MRCMLELINCDHFNVNLNLDLHVSYFLFLNRLKGVLVQGKGCNFHCRQFAKPDLFSAIDSVKL